MRLTQNQRSKLAEKICREWICKRHVKLKTPEVYVIWHSPKRTSGVWGRAYSGRRQLILHITRETSPNEWIVLLAHEFSHYLEHWTSHGKWRRINKPHGERFQRLLWSTLSKHQWPRASSGHWVQGSSKHKPEFQNG